jgi:hypothetical protein
VECGISVNRNLLHTLLILALLGGPPGARADHSLVLITSADSPVEEISPLDLRKLFLGFSVATDSGQEVRALSNTSDETVQQLFLQDVMGMSARSYNRRLLTLTLQSGRPRPEIYDNTDELLDHINNDVLSITFVWEEDIKDRDDVKVLRVLWHQ